MSIPESYPQIARQALTRLLDDLQSAEPEPRAVVVYGSLARGEFRPGDSDINLVIVLNDASPAVMATIRDPLMAASGAARIQPLVMTTAEVPRLADVFPIMIDDIKQYHDVIKGNDPFEAVAVKRVDLRLQVEHELRNHLFRLRRYYLFTGDDTQQLGRAIVSSSRALVYELGALLKVVGKEPADRGRAALFSAAGEAFDLDLEVLSGIREFKVSVSGDQEGVDKLFFGLLGVVEGAVNAVDQLDIKVWGSTSERAE